MNWKIIKKKKQNEFREFSYLIFFLFVAIYTYSMTHFRFSKTFLFQNHLQNIHFCMWICNLLRISHNLMQHEWAHLILRRLCTANKCLHSSNFAKSYGIIFTLTHTHCQLIHTLTAHCHNTHPRTHFSTVLNALQQ